MAQDKVESCMESLLRSVSLAALSTLLVLPGVVYASDQVGGTSGIAEERGIAGDIEAYRQVFRISPEEVDRAVEHKSVQVDSKSEKGQVDRLADRTDDQARAQQVQRAPLQAAKKIEGASVHARVECEQKQNTSAATNALAEKESDTEEAENVALAKRLAEAAAWTHFDLAHHYFSRLDLELADVEFEQSILNKADLPIVHRDYCLVCLVRFNIPKAIAEFMLATGLGVPVPYTPFEKAELDARAAKLHYRKALSYGRVNRWASAIAELKWALSYAPENPAIKRSLAFAYASSGLVEQAEGQYLSSFDADPNDAYSHADFAFLLYQEGKQDKAIGQLAKAVSLEPQVAALHIDLAWLSEKKGDLAKASGEMQEAVKLSPKHAILWAHLGRLLAQQGDGVAAREAYNKALALDAQQAEAKDGLNKLAEENP